MDMRTDAIETRKGARPPKGRKDANGQEAVIELGVLHEREEELCQLYTRAGEAAADYSTAITKAGEDSGLNAAAIRRYIAAKAGDKFDAEKKRVTQLALAFGVED